MIFSNITSIMIIIFDNKKIKFFCPEPAFVEKGPLNLLVKEGGKARMDCFIRGKPFPKVTWLLNGETVKNDSHVLING